MADNHNHQHHRHHHHQSQHHGDPGEESDDDVHRDQLDDSRHHHQHPDKHTSHRRPHHKHPHHKHQQQQQQQQTSRRSILIAMDGSAHSFFAFDWYMANLHSPDIEVIVAHSSSHNTTSFPPVHTLMSSGRDCMALSRVDQQEEAEVDRIVSQIKGRLTQAGVRGKLLRLTGDPGPAIVHAGAEHSVTCIVTGSRGLGTVKRALIGSVSDYILHHAHCPVMVCRNRDSAHKDRNHAYS